MIMRSTCMMAMRNIFHKVYFDGNHEDFEEEFYNDCEDNGEEPRDSDAIDYV